MRNVSILPTITVIGIGGALMVAFAIKGAMIGGGVLGGIALPNGVLVLFGVLGFVLGGVALLGALGISMIALTSERQRIGDLLAGTWVVRGSTGTMAAPPESAPPPRSG